MEALRQRFYEKYAQTQTKTVRNFMDSIDWNNRLIGIKGSRGVGKTTLLMQYIKLNYKPDTSVLYVSLDNLYFTQKNLYRVADEFYKKGGKFLALDEVHRYPDWAVELKNIYDDFPELKIAFTGSSLLQLHKAKADLSRRAVMYQMPGFSFREFLLFETGLMFNPNTLENLLENHVQIAIDINRQLKPLAFFTDYLQFGYYPFYMENKKVFHQKLSEILLTTLEVDIPQFEMIQTANIIYLKRLLKIISQSVPFKPNMNVLSSRTGISLNTMKNYLKYMADAELIAALYSPEKGINSLNKPEKLFLDNPNLMYNLADTMPELGNVRETFFLNQVKKNYHVESSSTADFFVNNRFTFEVGGSNKNKRQIQNINNSYLVKDDIEIGSEQTIPLWLFGFLY